MFEIVFDIDSVDPGVFVLVDMSAGKVVLFVTASFIEHVNVFLSCNRPAELVSPSVEHGENVRQLWALISFRGIHSLHTLHWRYFCFVPIVSPWLLVVMVGLASPSSKDPHPLSYFLHGPLACPLEVTW